MKPFSASLPATRELWPTLCPLAGAAFLDLVAPPAGWSRGLPPHTEIGDPALLKEHTIMRGGPFLKPSGRRKGWFSVAAVLVAVCSTGPTGAQPPPAAPAGPTNSVDAKPAPDGSILQTGCSTCGGGLMGGTLGLPSGGCSSCGSGGCDNGCYPGRPPYCRDGCYPDTFCGRVIGGIYDCLCCPDPCYDPPHWLAVADSAFFTDAARPITQQRLRWDSDFDIKNPDRAEYILARENTKALQHVASCKPNVPGNGFSCALHSIDLEELSLYTEGATGRVGVFASIPYREVDFHLASFENPANCQCQSQSGFADMTAGTKTLLLDCELMQMSFQFTTFIPIGQASKGLGTAHVSLEPALLFALKLTPTTYLQSEVAYWIPIGGDQVYQSDVFHAHVSLNHVLWCVDRRFQLIGTAELNEWTVFDGAYTTDFGNAFSNPPLYYGASGSTTIVSAGPGIRAVICDKIDVGVGTAFALTGQRWAEESIRAELRWRF